MVPWTFHDIRRGVRTRLSALKVDSDISERLLNHSASKLERTYDRFGYYQEKAEALQKWSDHFSAALAASPYAPVTAALAQAAE
jgi:hypothetical protein